MTLQNTSNKEKGKPHLAVGNNKKLLLLAGCGLLGLLLLIWGGGGFGASRGASSTPDRQDLAEYSAGVERSIERLCASVSGVSDVTAAVTLKSGFEYVYATNSQSKSDGGGEVKYITVGSGSGEGTVYITERLPEIAGIGIVCRGGSDPAVVKKLISLVCAAYGITSNKIYITGR